MLLRKTKTKIKTTMRKLMRKLKSRMILKGKLHDFTHSTNSVFTSFRLRTNFHTEPNRILHWDQTYLSVSEIFSQIHDDIRHAFLFTKRRLGTKLSNQLTTRWAFNKTKSPRSGYKWYISLMNCHQPRDQIVKSVNKLLSTTFNMNCESVSATVNQLAIRVRRPFIAHLLFFLDASPPQSTSLKEIDG